MTPTVKEKVKALIKKAKESGLKSRGYKSSIGFSLHRIIKTPAQARRFMRFLEASKGK
jgi:hypothetical protein